MPDPTPKAIFLSYARDDAVAARRRRSPIPAEAFPRIARIHADSCRSGFCILTHPGLL